MKGVDLVEVSRGAGDCECLLGNEARTVEVRGDENFSSYHRKPHLLILSGFMQPSLTHMPDLGKNMW